MNNIISVKEKGNKDTIKNDKIVKLPSEPKLGAKFRIEFYKFDIKTSFTSGRYLKSLLCRNKSKFLPNSFPVVYQLDCTCSNLYIGETKNKVITRSIGIEQNSFNRKQESSGAATEHCIECHGEFNWMNSKTLSTKQQYLDKK